MPPEPTITAANGRTFAAYPVAVQAIVVNDQDQLLLLSSPTRNGAGVWQTASGALDGGETVLAGALREIGEELGPDVRVRPVGVAHAQTFRYDEGAPFMIGIYYVFAYEGGEIQPGDDMVDSIWRWFSVAELADIKIHIPPDGAWLLAWAVAMAENWRATGKVARPVHSGAQPLENALLAGGTVSRRR